MKEKITMCLLITSVVLMIVNIILLVSVLNTNKYDINCDGEVNSKDLLDLRLYLIGEQNE